MYRSLLALSLAIPLIAGIPGKEAVKAYGSLPLHFVANRNQLDPRVKFVARGQGYALFLTTGDAVLALPAATLRMNLVDAKQPVRIGALDPLPGKVNYFVGSDPKGWHTDVPTYARVRYRDAWPGIDLVFHGDQGRLEYDFVIAPGADPN